MGMRWQDWMNMLIGLWLIVAPPIMAYTGGLGGTPAMNSYLVGLGLIVIPLLGMVAPGRWREWVVLALAVWLVLSPFILGFRGQGAEAWNTVGSGIVVAIGAIAALRAHGKGPVGA